PDHAQRGRQLLRPDEDQRDRADQEKLAPADVEHALLTPRGAATSPAGAPPLGPQPWCVRLRRRRGQPTLRLSPCDSAVGAGWRPDAFGSCLLSACGATGGAGW